MIKNKALNRNFYELDSTFVPIIRMKVERLMLFLKNDLGNNFLFNRKFSNIKIIFLKKKEIKKTSTLSLV